MIVNIVGQYRCTPKLVDKLITNKKIWKIFISFSNLESNNHINVCHTYIEILYTHVAGRVFYFVVGES